MIYNFETQLEYHTCGPLICTAGLCDPNSKGDNPIFGNQHFQRYDDSHMLATYHPKSSRVKFKLHLHLDLCTKKSQVKTKAAFK